MHINERQMESPCEAHLCVLRLALGPSALMLCVAEGAWGEQLGAGAAN